MQPMQWAKPTATLEPETGDCHGSFRAPQAFNSRRVGPGDYSAAEPAQLAGARRLGGRVGEEEGRRLGGGLLCLVQDQVECGEHGLPDGDEPNSDGDYAPIARLDPAFSPDPQRATGA